MVEQRLGWCDQRCFGDGKSDRSPEKCIVTSAYAVRYFFPGANADDGILCVRCPPRRRADGVARAPHQTSRRGSTSRRRLIFIDIVTPPCTRILTMLALSPMTLHDVAEDVCYMDDDDDETIVCCQDHTGAT